MADSFQLKAIITAVDQLTGPMKGMQRELKGFQKEMGSLALGAAAAGTAILGALALPINSAIGFESKMADIRKVVDGLDDKKAFAQMSDDILTLSTQLPMAAGSHARCAASGDETWPFEARRKPVVPDRPAGAFNRLLRAPCIQKTPWAYGEDRAKPEKRRGQPAYQRRFLSGVSVLRCSSWCEA